MDLLNIVVGMLLMVVSFLIAFMVIKWTPSVKFLNQAPKSAWKPRPAKILDGEHEHKKEQADN